jgi:hypothetical protein
MDSIVKKISYSFNYKNPESDVRKLLTDLISSLPQEITLYAAQIKAPNEQKEIEIPMELPLILGQSEKDNIHISISGQQLNVEKVLASDDNLNIILKKLKNIADSLINVLRENIDGFEINFCGIVSEGIIETDEDATDILKNRFIKNDSDLFDLRLRFTYKLKDIYFLNLLLANARTDKDLNKRIFFNMDMNTRYLYNYEKNLHFSKSYEDTLVDLTNSVLTSGVSDFIKGGNLYDFNKFNGDHI